MKIIVEKSEFGNAKILQNDTLYTNVKKLGEVVAKKSFFQTPILPQGTMFFQSCRDYAILVLEQPPRLRDIDLFGKRMTVAFPFVEFIFELSFDSYDQKWKIVSLKAFYSKQSIKSFEEELFIPDLSNLHSDCHVCMTGSRISDWSLKDLVENVLKDFWSTKFGIDLIPIEWLTFSKDLNKTVKKESAYWTLMRMKVWEFASQVNPNFYTEFSWQNSGKTINQLLFSWQADYAHDKNRFLNFDDVLDVLFRFQEV